MKYARNFFLLLCLASIQATGAPGAEPAAVNPILMDHFLKVAIDLRYHLPPFASEDVYKRVHRGPNRPYIERQAGKLLRIFLARANGKMESMDRHLRAAQEARAETIQASSPELRRASQQAWSHSLDRLSEEAGDLREMLAFVLYGFLNARNNSEPFEQGISGSAELEQEMTLLQKEVNAAMHRVKSFLFLPKHTVHINELREANMLERLHRVQKAADRLREAVHKV